MSKIAIIKTTSNPVADRIFAGVYGSLIREPSLKAGEPETTRMAIAPEFRNVSVLFTYLENGQAPVQLNEITEIEVADDQVGLMQNQIMLSLKNRWKTMYSGMAPVTGGSQSEMLNAMIRGEANTVDSAIAARFAVQGVRLYSVPVRATMVSEMHGASMASTQELLASLNTNSVTNVSVRTGELPAPAAAMAAIEGVPGNNGVMPAEVLAEVVETPVWHGYMGVEADVDGYMNVVARSPEEAVAAANMLIQASQAENSLMKPQVMPQAVVATREATYSDRVIDADDQVDSGYDDVDDNDVGRHYQF